MNGLPLPHGCPPGIARRKWGKWGQWQRLAALSDYWANLPEETQKALSQKYGQFASRTARRATFSAPPSGRG